MEYKGAYYEGTEYPVGSVVVGSDHVSYHLLKPAPAGTDPKDTKYWNRLSDFMNSVVLMFHDTIVDLQTGLAQAQAAIPTNVGESSIILKSTDETSTAEYLLTVDESGEDPEVIATLIEDEDDSGDETPAEDAPDSEGGDT